MASSTRWHGRGDRVFRVFPVRGMFSGAMRYECKSTRCSIVVSLATDMADVYAMLVMTRHKQNLTVNLCPNFVPYPFPITTIYKLDGARVEHSHTARINALKWYRGNTGVYIGAHIETGRFVVSGKTTIYSKNGGVDEVRYHKWADISLGAGYKFMFVVAKLQRIMYRARQRVAKDILDTCLDPDTASVALLYATRRVQVRWHRPIVPERYHCQASSPRAPLVAI